MNRLTKVFFSLLVVTSITALAYPALAERDKKDEGQKAFIMEVSVTGRPLFTLPVRVDEQKLAVIPVNGTTAYAVKIVPKAEGDSLHFNVLAVVEKLPETLTCDNMKTLMTDQSTSYAAREGDVVRVSDFEKFGVAPFTVKVLRVAQDQAVCPNGACCCGVNTCYPNPGACIECGSCGNCCRTAGGGGDNN
jgi:hypothetical protein